MHDCLFLIQYWCVDYVHKQTCKHQLLLVNLYSLTITIIHIGVLLIHATIISASYEDYMRNVFCTCFMSLCSFGYYYEQVTHDYGARIVQFESL